MKRVALIGFGLAGSVFHAPLIEATRGLRLTTVVTGDAERAAQARGDHPGAQILSSAGELWRRAHEHDVVVVATANDSHVALARAAIDSGLTTVVDKPLAPTSAEATELIGRAESAGVLLTPFHQRRWDSDFLTLRRLIAEGELGEVFRFESRFERWRPDNPAGSWRYEMPRARGGGVLLDLGTHLVDQALELFGPAAEVRGDVRSRRGTAADDDAFVSIRHECGVLSLLWASQVAASQGSRMRVLGSTAAFEVEGLDGQEEALRSGLRPGPGRWGIEPRKRWGRLVRGEDAEPVVPERGAWQEFYARLAAGRTPVEARDARDVLLVLEAAAG